MVGWICHRSGSSLTTGNEAELLLATLHRMWPDWAAAKPFLQVQSGAADVMKAMTTQNCLLQHHIAVGNL